MNNDGRITDPNNRVIADDYLEVGDRERIVDDNARRLMTMTLISTVIESLDMKMTISSMITTPLIVML